MVVLPIIVPSTVWYKLPLNSKYPGGLVKRYAYQFNGMRQEGFDETTLPPFDGSEREVKIFSPSLATDEPLKMIKDKAYTIS